MIITDLFIVFVFFTAAFSGSRRGVVYLATELISLATATAGALLAYGNLGTALRGIAPISAALANVAAFLVLWMLIEVGMSLVARYWALPRLRKLRVSERQNYFGGAALSVLKATLITIAVLWLIIGSPLPLKIKRSILDAHIPNLLVNQTAVRQWWAADGLGRDLRESFSFSVSSTESGSDKTVSLGFTTTVVHSDAVAEQKMLDLINRDRATAGLLPLKINTKARDVARAYAREMFAGGYFSHTDAQGNDASVRLRDGNVFFDAAGENLAYSPNIEEAHDGLMNSPAHRTNILSSVFRTAGIGVIDGGAYGLMVVENFTD